MDLKFYKYHGLGNDFIIIDNREAELESIYDFPKLVIYLCNRHFGIGADGVLLVENSKSQSIKYRIFNQDGNEAEICGNGIRCYAKFLIDQKICSGQMIEIETKIGIYKCEILQNDLYKICMGQATLDPSIIPSTFKQQVINQPVSFDDSNNFKITLINTGNPHCVIYVDDVNKFPVQQIGALIQSRLDLFPKSINVEFVQIIKSNYIKMRVYERGCGETTACGTGACAAVVSGIINKFNEGKTTVELQGGILIIEVNEMLIMHKTGPATFVFSGTVQNIPLHYLKNNK